jgi:hypothetical protein
VLLAPSATIWALALAMAARLSSAAMIGRMNMGRGIDYRFAVPANCSVLIFLSRNFTVRTYNHGIRE